MAAKLTQRSSRALLQFKGTSCASLSLVLIAATVILFVVSDSPLAATLLGGSLISSSSNEESGLEEGPVAARNFDSAAAPLESIVTLDNLPPRIDASCEDAELAAEELYLCRQAAAQQLAQLACDQLADSPPDPPFQRAELSLSHLKSLGHSGTGVPVPDTVAMAVEGDSDFVSAGLRRDGTWEESELHTVLTALERAAPLRPDGGDPVLLDIGANLGTYTLMAAAFGYPVRAFEAMPRNVAAIHQTLCWNPALAERVTLFPFALAEEDARCAVLVARFNVANGLLACSDEQLQVHEGFEVAGHTHAVRLGEYLGAVRSDVMKMDVEGFEPMVVRSAGAALDGVQTAATEINSDQLPKQSGLPYDEVITAYLEGWQARGFEMHVCQGKGVWKPCMDKPLASTEDVCERGRAAIIDVIMQRP
eukprot:jgi/Ulvmu1/1220/UM109_0018.1